MNPFLPQRSIRLSEEILRSAFQAPNAIKVVANAAVLAGMALGASIAVVQDPFMAVPALMAVIVLMVAGFAECDYGLSDDVGRSLLMSFILMPTTILSFLILAACPVAWLAGLAGAVFALHVLGTPILGLASAAILLIGVAAAIMPSIRH